jgi:hypothetical protein
MIKTSIQRSPHESFYGMHQFSQRTFSRKLPTCLICSRKVPTCLYRQKERAHIFLWTACTEP